MNAYPSEYVAVNKPLYVLSGLDADESPKHSLQSHGPRVGTDQARIGSSRSQQILSAFERIQDEEPWVGEDQGREKLSAFVRVSRAVSVDSLSFFSP